MTEPAPQGLTKTHPDILFGHPDAALLREEILADLLEATAARAPDQAALVFGDVTLSYRELNAQAALVAARLLAAGVRPGQIVGLWLPRGIELLVAQAGIAKAGAAWLPVDEDTPARRWRRASNTSTARPGPSKPCWPRPRMAKCWPRAARFRPTCRPM